MDDTTADEDEQANNHDESVAAEVCLDYEFFSLKIDSDAGDDDIEVQFISNQADEDIIDSFKDNVQSKEVLTTIAKLDGE